MQTAKAGMEIAHTLEIIERLGENTGSEMVALTDRMIELGYNGPRGPKEISEAFKVLSLAGLKANDVLAVTQTVLDFSTAGTTDLQTAADVLVSVTTAFGTGAAGFERSADIIARAAADSKASVESFGEAMKTASVVGEQYGATQEDVALQIQYLAQLGIQGSAAGTAIRNMYADITGRSGQVTKILKSLNLDFKDATGSVVPLTEQMRLLSGVLSQYDAKSQGNLLQAIFGERGAKSAVASLQAYQTAAKDSSRFSNKLEEDLARVGAAGGEAAINAAHLGQTTQKAFEAAGATFRTTMFAAFQEMEPQLYLMANAFREAFASDEARQGLITLTSTVADAFGAPCHGLGRFPAHCRCSYRCAGSDLGGPGPVREHEGRCHSSNGRADSSRAPLCRRRGGSGRSHCCSWSSYRR
jgi:TP901 family phage tail tape measure protein